VHLGQDVVSGAELHVRPEPVEEVDVVTVTPDVLGVFQRGPVVPPPRKPVVLLERVVGNESESLRKFFRVQIIRDILGVGRESVT